MSASSEIGGMNEEKSDATFKSAFGDLRRCFEEGQSRLEFLSGEVSFLVRVDQTGKAEALVERSTLGDRRTERCMIGALASLSWPPPVGGRIGEARRPFVFDPPSDVRLPVDWSAQDVEKTLDKLGESISDCKGASGASFEATVYVDRDGTVMSAGTTAPLSDAAAVADCITDALSSATFPSPGSWPAKATFVL